MSLYAMRHVSVVGGVTSKDVAFASAWLRLEMGSGLGRPPNVRDYGW